VGGGKCSRRRKKNPPQDAGEREEGPPDAPSKRKDQRQVDGWSEMLKQKTRDEKNVLTMGGGGEPPGRGGVGFEGVGWEYSMEKKNMEGKKGKKTVPPEKKAKHI